MNYICNVLDWMGRRGRFGWKDVDRLRCCNLGQLCHMKRRAVQKHILRSSVGGETFRRSRAGWQQSISGSTVNDWCKAPVEDCFPDEVDKINAFLAIILE